jgi:hypothetical protein
MILNMAGNRRKAFRNRFAKPPPPPRGLVWPITDVKEGTGEEIRSSTDTSKSILAAAVGSVDAKAAEDVKAEKKWRFGYVKHLAKMVEVQCKSPEDALRIARAGLDAAYSTFQFVSKDGNTTTTFAEAMSAKNDTKFFTGYVRGEVPPEKNRKLEIAYKGRKISGDELKAQVRKWVDYGTIEPSAGDAIILCSENPKWIDLSDRYFVLLGAGSAMGPLEVLLSLGANVVAIDLDRPFIWKRLIESAKNSSGSITFPMTKEQKDCATDDDIYGCAGCNLFTETPIVRDWLVDLYPGKAFTIGSYAYLNGALHVQVSLAMDAICRDLCARREAGKTSLAYLCTPTDLHLVPKEAHDAAASAYADYSKSPFCSVMKLLGGKKLLRKNVRDPVSGTGGDFYYVNGISVAQGPNYGKNGIRSRSCRDGTRSLFFLPPTFALVFRCFHHPLMSPSPHSSALDPVSQPWRSGCSTGAPSSRATRGASCLRTSRPPRPPRPWSRIAPSPGPTRVCRTSPRTRSSLRRLPSR